MAANATKQPQAGPSATSNLLSPGAAFEQTREAGSGAQRRKSTLSGNGFFIDRSCTRRRSSQAVYQQQAKQQHDLRNQNQFLRAYASPVRFARASLSNPTSAGPAQPAEVGSPSGSPSRFQGRLSRASCSAASTTSPSSPVNCAGGPAAPANLALVPAPLQAPFALAGSRKTSIFDPTGHSIGMSKQQLLSRRRKSTMVTGGGLHQPRGPLITIEPTPAYSARSRRKSSVAAAISTTTALHSNRLGFPMGRKDELVNHVPVIGCSPTSIRASLAVLDETRRYEKLLRRLHRNQRKKEKRKLKEFKRLYCDDDEENLNDESGQMGAGRDFDDYANRNYFFNYPESNKLSPHQQDDNFCTENQLNSCSASNNNNNKNPDFNGKNNEKSQSLRRKSIRAIRGAANLIKSAATSAGASKRLSSSRARQRLDTLDNLSLSSMSFTSARASMPSLLSIDCYEREDVNGEGNGRYEFHNDDLFLDFDNDDYEDDDDDDDDEIARDLNQDGNENEGESETPNGSGATPMGAREGFFQCKDNLKIDLGSANLRNERRKSIGRKKSIIKMAMKRLTSAASGSNQNLQNQFNCHDLRRPEREIKSLGVACQSGGSGLSQSGADCLFGDDNGQRRIRNLSEQSGAKSGGLKNFKQTRRKSISIAGNLNYWYYYYYYLLRDDSGLNNDFKLSNDLNFIPSAGSPFETNLVTRNEDSNFLFASSQVVAASATEPSLACELERKTQLHINYSLARLEILNSRTDPVEQLAKQVAQVEQTIQNEESNSSHNIPSNAPASEQQAYPASHSDCNPAISGDEDPLFYFNQSTDISLALSSSSNSIESIEFVNPSREEPQKGRKLRGASFKRVGSVFKKSPQTSARHNFDRSACSRSQLDHLNSSSSSTSGSSYSSNSSEFSRNGPSSARSYSSSCSSSTSTTIFSGESDGHFRPTNFQPDGGAKDFGGDKCLSSNGSLSLAAGFQRSACSARQSGSALLSSRKQFKSAQSIMHNPASELPSMLGAVNYLSPLVRSGSNHERRAPASGNRRQLHQRASLGLNSERRRQRSQQSNSSLRLGAVASLPLGREAAPSSGGLTKRQEEEEEEMDDFERFNQSHRGYKLSSERQNKLPLDGDANQSSNKQANKTDSKRNRKTKQEGGSSGAGLEAARTIRTRISSLKLSLKRKATGGRKGPQAGDGGASGAGDDANGAGEAGAASRTSDRSQLARARQFEGARGSQADERPAVAGADLIRPEGGGRGEQIRPQPGPNQERLEDLAPLGRGGQVCARRRARKMNESERVCGEPGGLPGGGAPAMPMMMSNNLGELVLSGSGGSAANLNALGSGHYLTRPSNYPIIESNSHQSINNDDDNNGKSFHLLQNFQTQNNCPNGNSNDDASVCNQNFNQCNDCHQQAPYDGHQCCWLQSSEQRENYYQAEPETGAYFGSQPGQVCDNQGANQGDNQDDNQNSTGNYWQDNFLAQQWQQLAQQNLFYGQQMRAKSDFNLCSSQLDFDANFSQLDWQASPFRQLHQQQQPPPQQLAYINHFATPLWAQLAAPEAAQYSSSSQLENNRDNYYHHSQADNQVMPTMSSPLLLAPDGGKLSKGRRLSASLKVPKWRQEEQRKQRQRNLLSPMTQPASGQGGAQETHTAGPGNRVNGCEEDEEANFRPDEEACRGRVRAYSTGTKLGRPNCGPHISSQNISINVTLQNHDNYERVKTEHSNQDREAESSSSAAALCKSKSEVAMNSQERLERREEPAEVERTIERRLKERNLLLLRKKSFNCLLLGSGQTGKRTIVKCFIKLLNEFKLAVYEYKKEKILTKLMICSEKLQEFETRKEEQLMAIERAAKQTVAHRDADEQQPGLEANERRESLNRIRSNSWFGNVESFNKLLSPKNVKRRLHSFVGISSGSNQEAPPARQNVPNLEIKIEADLEEPEARECKSNYGKLLGSELSRTSNEFPMNPKGEQLAEQEKLSIHNQIQSAGQDVVIHKLDVPKKFDWPNNNNNNSGGNSKTIGSRRSLGCFETDERVFRENRENLNRGFRKSTQLITNKEGCLIRDDGSDCKRKSIQFVNFQQRFKPISSLKEINKRMIKIKFKTRRQLKQEKYLTNEFSPPNEAPDLFVVVYAVNDRESFEFAASLVKKLRDFAFDVPMPIVLVANKIDLERAKVIKTEEGRNLARRNCCKFVEISCTVGHNLDNLLVGLRTQLVLKHHSILNSILRHGKLPMKIGDYPIKQGSDKVPNNKLDNTQQHNQTREKEKGNTANILKRFYRKFVIDSVLNYNNDQNLNYDCDNFSTL